MRNKVNILWSGGWDGTFRMLQLCQYDIDIQPIYVIDKPRRSNTIEQERIREIRNILNDRYKANILEIKYFDKDWIFQNCKNAEISEAFQYLKSKYGVGTQYEWFALLSSYLGNEKMECGVVHQYHGKVENAIEGEGSLAIVKDDFLPERFAIAASKTKSGGCPN